MKCHRRERNRAVGTGEACQAGSEILSQPREGGFAINRELLMSCVIVAMMIISMATVQASVQEANPTTVEVVVYDFLANRTDREATPGVPTRAFHTACLRIMPGTRALAGFPATERTRPSPPGGMCTNGRRDRHSTIIGGPRSIPARPYPKTRRLFIHPWRY